MWIYEPYSDGCEVWHFTRHLRSCAIFFLRYNLQNHAVHKESIQSWLLGLFSHWFFVAEASSFCFHCGLGLQGNISIRSVFPVKNTEKTHGTKQGSRLDMFLFLHPTLFLGVWILPRSHPPGTANPAPGVQGHGQGDLGHLLRGGLHRGRPEAWCLAAGGVPDSTPQKNEMEK